jgi:Uma2 family endonuclease
MPVKNPDVDLNLPLAQWPVFYKDGLPFIYDDDEFFYDKDGNKLGEHSRHSNLGIFLRELLRWQFRKQDCTISYNLTFRASKLVDELAAADASSEGRRYIDITPDVALIRGAAPIDFATYVIGPGNPPPQVVIEIGSPSTFTEDLGRKLRLYAEVVQAREYFTYDPHRKRLWKGARLKGWRMINGVYQELEPDERGWIWSEELESWLAEDGPNLWLYDKDGNRRLQEGEEEKLRADNAEAKLEEEKLRAEQAEAFAQEEKRRADQLESRLRELEERLRKARGETEGE